MKKWIVDMITKGWIRPSLSPYGALILFVPKKTGKLHMCVDFQTFNSNTQLDVFFSPHISDLLNWLGRATVFSSNDLAHILIGTYSQIGYTQKSISYKQRPL